MRARPCWYTTKISSRSEWIETDSTEDRVPGKIRSTVDSDDEPSVSVTRATGELAETKTNVHAETPSDTSRRPHASTDCTEEANKFHRPNSVQFLPVSSDVRYNCGATYLVGHSRKIPGASYAMYGADDQDGTAA